MKPAGVTHLDATAVPGEVPLRLARLQTEIVAPVSSRPFPPRGAVATYPAPFPSAPGNARSSLSGLPRLLARRIGIAAVMAGLFSGAAAAQPPCGPRDLLAEELSKRYGETVQSAGVNRRGMLVEMYANLDTGSWTIMWTQPSGASCLVDSGQGWSAEPNKPGKGA